MGCLCLYTYIPEEFMKRQGENECDEDGQTNQIAIYIIWWNRVQISISFDCLMKYTMTEHWSHIIRKCNGIHNKMKY